MGHKNDLKIKSMPIAHSIKHLIFGSFTLDQVDFKYLGVNIYHKNHIIYNEV